MTVASCILRALAHHGVKHLFGVPGGGSSLALIEAAGRTGIEFVLTRTETAAALMGAVSGELGTAPGVVLTGIGPGAASAVNGVAYASLERAPLLLFTDGPASSQHQGFDQSALFSPISKTSLQLKPHTAVADIEAAIQTAWRVPQGPVHINLSAEDAMARITPQQHLVSTESPTLSPDPEQLTQAAGMLNDCRRPIIIAGLDSRRCGGPGALRSLAQSLACPVLLTYKAKGVMADTAPNMAGLFTGARPEADCLEQADLIVLFGLDPVEIIPGSWPGNAPILDLCTVETHTYPVSPQCRIQGPLNESTALLQAAMDKKDWALTDIAQMRAALHARMALAGSGHTVATVLKELIKTAPEDCRLCVDAGAHMFSAMNLWPASNAFDVLKSNGLSTMGFALPAAIASALQDPQRPVVALTGDGGLLMCLTELTTAISHSCRLLVLVINDAALSLIDIKQQRQQQPSCGVRYAAVDFAAVAAALGCDAWRIESNEDLTPALSAAFACGGPALVDVRVDASGYGKQLEVLRG